MWHHPLLRGVRALALAMMRLLWGNLCWLLLLLLLLRLARHSALLSGWPLSLCLRWWLRQHSRLRWRWLEALPLKARGMRQAGANGAGPRSQRSCVWL